MGAGFCDIYIVVQSASVQGATYLATGGQANNTPQALCALSFHNFSINRGLQKTMIIKRRVPDG